MSRVKMLRCDVLDCENVGESLPAATIRVSEDQEMRLNVCEEHVEEIFGEQALYARRGRKAEAAAA